MNTSKEFDYLYDILDVVSDIYVHMLNLVETLKF